MGNPFIHIESTKFPVVAEEEDELVNEENVAGNLSVWRSKKTVHFDTDVENVLP